MNTDNLVYFLREKNTRILVFKTPFFSSAIPNIKNASDFDVFNALCNQLYLFAGHPIRKCFLNLLSESLSAEVPINMLYDPEYRKKLWQKIFFDPSVSLPTSTVNIENYANIVKKTEFFNINSAIKTSFDNIYFLLENTLEQIKLQGAEECFFDVEKIEYIRPDDFHSQISYENLKNGKSDNSLVALWLLCRVLMNCNINLVLKVDNIKKAEDILMLIFKLGLSPKTVIDINISKYIDYNMLYQFLMLHNEKNISLKLSCSKESVDENDILDFLRIVPIIFVERTNINIQVMQNVLSSILSKEETVCAISRLYQVK